MGWGRGQVEGSPVATFTVPTGEVHEDFRTLKEEIQRETQEVERLSRAGQRSLLTSLSKLLGKKKELQDLELTVRPQRKEGRGRGRRGGRKGSGSGLCGPCSWRGSDTGRKSVARALGNGCLPQGWPSAPPPAPGCQATPPLVPPEKGPPCSLPQGRWTEGDNGPTRPSLGKGLEHSFPECRAQEK